MVDPWAGCDYWPNCIQVDPTGAELGLVLGNDLEERLSPMDQLRYSAVLGFGTRLDGGPMISARHDGLLVWLHGSVG